MGSTDNVTPDFLEIFGKSEKPKPKPEENYAPSPYAENYKMNHHKRGIAVIFNHVNFSRRECPKREGSDRDRDDLIELFRELDFDVLVHNDLTASESAGVLITISKMDHSDSDCLVVVVMSHGDNGKIYARDRDYPTRRLWMYFNASNCPSLAGKPKFFFIQACRGTGVHPSATLKYPTSEDKTNDEAFYSIPIMSDILVMYSTMEGFYSWRDTEEGSYFIQSLVKQLRDHHKTRDLLTILTFVNREVAVDFTSKSDDRDFSGTKQMCSIVSMLTRLVYFKDTKTLF